MTLGKISLSAVIVKGQIAKKSLNVLRLPSLHSHVCSLPVYHRCCSLGRLKKVDALCGESMQASMSAKLFRDYRLQARYADVGRQACDVNGHVGREDL